MALTHENSVRILVAIAAVVALVLAMDVLALTGKQWLAAWIRLETHYFFALLGVLLPPAFLLYPRNRWLDASFALLTVGVCGYFFLNAELIVDEAWEFGAPALATWMSAGLWLLLLEALRRSAGWALFFIAGIFSLLPIVADVVPAPLTGLAASWQETAVYHALSIESIFGLPFRAFANLVIGFVVFGIALQHTGGGRFFLDLAFALLGRVRGGPAKVAIVSSGLMGSMSGSVVTNVLTTGQMTIPAMQKAGLGDEYAGGVEACASTGGVLLPPIMGSTAFVMATFLEVPYFEVALAAALPALLYFGGLFLQVDAYAASRNLAGLADEDIPSIVRTIKEGWYYLGAFAVLVFLLLYLQREAVAPYIATAALLVLNQFSGRMRWGRRQLVEFVTATGALLVELVVVLAGVGLIVGALSVTGLSGTLVNDLLFIAGDSIALLLVMGAVTSFVLGIGMTVTAAYIFLAIILAPALVEAGLPAMSVHLFVLYWAMLSFITPPVALGAYAASTIAGSNPLKTGVAAMRLGSVIYFIPFLFVLEPALVLEGTGADIALAMLRAAAGVWLIVGALQGFLVGVGEGFQMWARGLLLIAGLSAAAPAVDSATLQLSTPVLTTAAAVCLAVAVTARCLRRQL
ncbi:MAG: TRAP transporter fused permease subunit [Pseudomonadales bacterium]|nr:TRAP transporter fused permease subunit [Pseudomonadales bacterium]MDP6471392.1 TRAP transporter fused permease subunit [Pseudomonadales bacterium]MDP6826416.1 TRAP transporter fused permease subunit [Pseudomonadales bacterium]MDP6970969.1 TRAP transporter fused permease subunit [Pseudomonadales bacterium]